MNKKFFLKNCRLVWTQTCMNNQVNDTGSGEPPVLFLEKKIPKIHIFYKQVINRPMVTGNLVSLVRCLVLFLLRTVHVWEETMIGGGMITHVIVTSLPTSIFVSSVSFLIFYFENVVGWWLVDCSKGIFFSTHGRWLYWYS